VLRLHRPGYSTIDELESERVWIRALKATGVTLQDSIETARGGHYALVDIAGGAEKRYAGMTTWQEGIPLRDFLESCQDAEERMRMLRRFGEIAAVFHDQSTHWQPPPGFVRRRLDLDALLGETPFWGRFWEHPALTESQRDLLLRARDELRVALSAYGETAENFSLIHADFTPDNVICNGDDLVIIDFDDAGFGWHMYDIASALIEYRFDRDFESLQSVFLDGYRKRRPLPKQDIDLLPEFALVRGMAIIGWFHQRPEYDGAAYFERFKNWVLEECERKGY
ncbi:MAG: phosphotransferase, partial [Gammaproteobacteria bacterium]|nr:phosphotransferase [Gammaproteobacteria bacterium]